MKLKRFFITILSITLVALAIAFMSSASEVVVEGPCAEESTVTYKIMSDNSLVIEGSGAMPDFTDVERPWDSYASSILTLVIGEDITYVGADAFVNISASVTIPETVTDIGDHAFGFLLVDGEYTAISGYTITGEDGSAAETYADENGFEFISLTPPVISDKCGTNLTFTLTHDGVLTIKGKGSMDDFDSSGSTPWSSYTSGNGYYVIKKIVIENGVNHIGNNAFANCYSLTEVSLPTSLKTIGDYAFSSCSSLEEIEIGSSVIGIGERAFQLCGLRSIIIPHGVVGFEEAVFYGCEDLTTVYYNAYMIPVKAFAECTSLQKIIMYSGVEIIEESAFEGCVRLKSVGISNTVTTIGDRAFYGCTSIADIELSNKVKTVGKSAFYGCTGLTTVSVGTGLTTIDDFAFFGCTALEAVDFGTSSVVSSIGEKAFYGCTSLSTVVAPASLSTYGKYSFSECTSLVNFIFSDATKSIPEGMFYNCSSLATVTIGDSTAEICDYAFVGCTSLRSIFISYKVKSIGEYAIGYEFVEGEYVLISKFTTDIESFTPSVAKNYAEENGLTFTNYKTVDTDTGDLTDTINWRFRPSTGVLNIIGTGKMPDYLSFDETPWAIYKEYIKQVTISSGITSVGSYSFFGCYNVQKIDIPGTVQIIGTSAFSGTSIITATIPSGVREIANSAFENCPALYTVTLPATLTSIGEAAFKGPNSMITISVPQSVTFIGDMALGYTGDGEVLDGFTIKGVEGSVADTYASDNNITFIVNGYQEVSDKNTGVTVSIPEGNYTDLKVNFIKIAGNLEPGILLAPNQTAIRYRIQVQDADKVLNVAGPVSIIIPVPDGMDSYIVNIYAINANGQYVPINYEKVGDKYSFSYDALGDFVVTTADLSDLRTITINYVFTDGTTAADTKYIKAATGAKYRFTAEELEGCTVNISALTGTVGEDNLTLEFVYAQAGAFDPPETTDDVPGGKGIGKGAITILIIILILLFIALFAALLTLLFIKSRKDKQVKETKKTIAAASKNKQDGDILAKTMVVPDFATREIDIESLFADDPEEDLDAEETFRNKK